MTDATRCRMHGGKTPKSQARIAKARLAADVRDAVREIGIEEVTDPLKAFARHAGEVIAVRDYLRGEVNRLEELRYQSGAGEQLRAELAAYQGALRDTTQVLAVYARLNIDERLVRISEMQVGVIVEALNAGLDAADIRDWDTRQRARAAVAAALRKYRTEETVAREVVPGEVVRVNGSRP